MRAVAEKLFAARGIVAVAALCAFAVVLLTGCVSKSKAEAQAQNAYLAGQRAALFQMQQAPREGSVTFIGPVTTPIVKWFDGLTLSQGILSAGYNVPNDPKAIYIRRNGQQIPIDPKRLLAGEDYPLLAGDVVEFLQ